MKHLIGLLVLFFSLSTQTEQETIYEIGDELEARKHSSLVLFHYKKDVNKVILLKKQIISYEDNFNFATVDSRDLYKIKRGEKIILTESLKEGETDASVFASIHLSSSVGSCEQPPRTSKVSKVMVRCFI